MPLNIARLLLVYSLFKTPDERTPTNPSCPVANVLNRELAMRDAMLTLPPVLNN